VLDRGTRSTNATVPTRLADEGIGTWARVGADGTPTVVLRAETVGEHLDSAGRAILRYSSGEPYVTAALLRLAHQVERVAASDRDRELAQSLDHGIEAVGDDDGPHDSS
jgi:hypothetical protein